MSTSARVRRRTLPATTAAVLAGALFAACGGGGSSTTSPKGGVCAQVQQAVSAVGAKHSKASDVQTKISQTADAAKATSDPRLQQLGSNLSSAQAAGRGPNGAGAFQVAGALAALQQACQSHG